MKGYSKMKIVHSPSPTRSKEALEHLTSPEHQTMSCKKTDKEPPELQEISTNEIIKSKNSKNTSVKKNQDNPFIGFEEDEEMRNKDIIRNEEEILAAARSRLKRNSSVSAAASTMKKAFSIRRSTSVSDRYCRIHDQSSVPSPTTHHHPDFDLDADADLNPDGLVSKSRSVKKKNTRSRILKACKKLIGK
ncbi:hypothetical protein M5689_000949 [Euphorbia peplus]|nr:hypothetical protein M5689_000949 [Euphorbia peplus]